MTKNKMPLNAFKTIFDWAISCQIDPKFDFTQIQTPCSQKSMLKDVSSELHIDMDQFEPQSVWLLLDNLLLQLLYVLSGKQRIMFITEQFERVGLVLCIHFTTNCMISHMTYATSILTRLWTTQMSPSEKGCNNI